MVKSGEKTMNKILAGAAMASGVLLLAGSVMAEGREDFYTQTNQQRYFNMAENARTFGMAGSSVPTSSDSSSVAGNPAGLGFMKDAEVSATYYRDTISGNDAADYGDVETDIDGGHVLAAVPLAPTLDGTPKYGTLGLGWSGAKGEADDVANSDGKGYSLTVAYGKDLSDSLALGYSAAFVHKKFTAHSATTDFSSKMDNGVVQTVGLQKKLSSATTLGVDTNFGFGTYESEATSGGNVAQGEDEDIHSWGAEVGVGHTMGATTLAGAIDYETYQSDIGDDSYAWGIRTGLEQAFTDWLKGRIGYRYQANFDYDAGFGNDNAKYNAVSLGAGVKLMKNLFADYGTEYRWVGDGSDWTHTVTLSVPFSLCAN